MMGKRFACLSAVVAVAAVVSVAIPAAADEEHVPAMTEQHGKVVRDEPAALRVEDMTEAELEQRRAEWEAGKRDDRDGYIVLNQIWFNHQAKRASSSPEFQAVSKKRGELLKKHPEFGRLKDFRLSNRIKHDQERVKTEQRQRLEAQQFTPTDTTPMNVRGENGKAIVAYQYRIEFYKLPADIEVQGDAKAGSMQLLRAGKEVLPSTITAIKTIPFKRPVNVRFARDSQGNIVFGNILACTDLLRGYSATSGREFELIRRSSNRRSLPWINPRGQDEDFCGVISPEGRIVYRFPFQQKRPKQLLSPLNINAAGTKAVVMVGQETSAGPDAEPSTAYPSEVLVWESPDKFKRYSRDDAPEDVRKLIAPYPRKP